MPCWAVSDVRYKWVFLVPCKSYQKFVNTERHLPLGSSNGHLIARLLSAGEDDLAVPFPLQIFDLRQPSEKLAMVEPVDIDDLRRELGILFASRLTTDVTLGVGSGRAYNTINHLQNLALNKLKVLGIAGGGSADDIVNSAVVVLPAHATPIHRIGELDEDGMFFHDALDMLAANANNTLVVLVRHVKRDGCRHLLLHQAQALLHGVVCMALNFDVEVVLAKVVKHNLDVALPHDFVDFSILLSTDKLLVLIGELDLDSNLVLRVHHKFDLRDHHQSSFDSLVRACNVKCQLVKANISI